MTASATRGVQPANPYLITGPALISFSGGRTSAFMLKQIIDAHGGTLPSDIHVAFANTGKERAETLRFVHECETRWGVVIHWIEWRKDGEFERVGFNSASREGEPFQALIDKKKRLPNWNERWCTEFLKVRPLTALAKVLGLKTGSYAEVVGLRYDEGHRIIKAMHNAEFKKVKGVDVPRKIKRTMAFPLSRARVTKADVLTFWLGQSMTLAAGETPQGFDLGLEPWEGNCDLCFLKGRGIRKRIIRDDPSRVMWWSTNEAAHKGKQERGWFDKRDSVAGLADEVRRSPELFEPIDPEEYDAECGLTCAGEAA